MLFHPKNFVIMIVYKFTLIQFFLIPNYQNVAHDEKLNVKKILSLHILEKHKLFEIIKKYHINLKFI